MNTLFKLQNNQKILIFLAVLFPEKSLNELC